MNLPAALRKNITETFGKTGERWLTSLEKRVSQCISLWQLQDCHPVENLSFNYVCTAVSPRWGDVILKIAVKSSELESEYNMLSSMDPSTTCRCYDIKRDLNAILIERLKPGNNLYSLQSVKKQIAIAGEIIGGASGELDQGANHYPQYSEWLDRSFEKVRTKNRSNNKIEEIFLKTRQYYNDLNESPLPDRLLHGDFHHQNILKKDDQWILIDPKGVVGKQPTDCGRFIMNQLGIIERDKHKLYVRKMAETFASALNTGMKEIYKGALVDRVLSCSWSLEGQITNEQVEALHRELIYTDELYGDLIHE